MCWQAWCFFGFLASILVRPVFVYRYMIPAMGCFWLAFAVGVDEIWESRQEEADAGGRKQRTRNVTAAMILLFVTVVGLRDYRAFMGEEEYKILLMKEAEAALSAIEPGDVVVYNFDQVQAVTSYYLPKETASYLWCAAPEELIQDMIRPYESIEDTAQIRALCSQDRSVWFIGSFNSRDDIVAQWDAEGVKAEETGSYLLERYWFNLYKISLERP